MKIHSTKKFSFMRGRARYLSSVWPMRLIHNSSKSSSDSSSNSSMVYGWMVTTAAMIFMGTTTTTFMISDSSRKSSFTAASGGGKNGSYDRHSIFLTSNVSWAEPALLKQPRNVMLHRMRSAAGRGLNDKYNVDWETVLGGKESGPNL